MYKQVLQYRRFVQTFRSEVEKRNKLRSIAERMRGDGAVEAKMRAILEAFRRGDDILDPEFFDREDIVAFAEQNGVQNDPLVVEFIGRAKPRSI